MGGLITSGQGVRIQNQLPIAWLMSCLTTDVRYSTKMSNLCVYVAENLQREGFHGATIGAKHGFLCWSKMEIVPVVASKWNFQVQATCLNTFLCNMGLNSMNLMSLTLCAQIQLPFNTAANLLLRVNSLCYNNIRRQISRFFSLTTKTKMKTNAVQIFVHFTEFSGWQTVATVDSQATTSLTGTSAPSQ